MSIYEKEGGDGGREGGGGGGGGQNPVNTRDRGSGGMLPQKFLDFRLSKTASGTF